jgi:LysR family transcriptional regulator, transcriptional activator of nhaA
MSRLNFHHLHYFWAVAKEGHLTRAAAHLHVSQSALSAQIRQLEEQLGQPLFHRVGRGLQLTEAGQLALGYAESIFAAGTELTALLRDGRREQRQVLRIGAVATLSRNFQENFLRPMLARDDVELALQSGTLADLLARLRVHTLDLVLCNQRVHASSEDPWRCQRVARQPVSLVGKPRPKRRAFRFPDELAEVPLLLPGLLRLLARDSDSVALLPTVVVQDELRSGRLVEYGVVPDLHENFYAISVKRHFEPPLLKALLKQSEAAVLGAAVG